MLIPCDNCHTIDSHDGKNMPFDFVTLCIATYIQYIDLSMEQDGKKAPFDNVSMW